MSQSVCDYRGVIHRYRAYLPVGDTTPIVTLHEGNTPLLPAPALSGLMGKNVEVFLKYEGLNPTGSFKDRGMTMAISKIKEGRQKAVICASTGNTSASAAAYAVRAGLTCVVVIPEGAIALGKLSQALIHGACVIQIKGNFDVALELVREATERHPIALVNSINPFRIEGQKTGAFEICDTLRDAPVFCALPVGNAGNITAYWKGFCEYAAQGKISSKPMMLGFQAAGSAPIVKGKVIKNPHTIATAIKIGNPASWKKAEEALEQSRGRINMVTDREILAAYRLLAQKEGVFVEPASASSIAGIMKLKEKGFFDRYRTRKISIVCILTGHGLKDPDRAIRQIRLPKPVSPKLENILKAARL